MKRNAKIVKFVYIAASIVFIIGFWVVIYRYIQLYNLSHSDMVELDLIKTARMTIFRAVFLFSALLSIICSSANMLNAPDTKHIIVFVCTSLMHAVLVALSYLLANDTGFYICLAVNLTLGMATLSLLITEISINKKRTRRNEQK